MKKLIISSLILSLAIILFGGMGVRTAQAVETLGPPTLKETTDAQKLGPPTKVEQDTQNATKEDSETATKASTITCTGVLVSGCAKDMSFGQYVEAILKEIIPLALFLAMILIAWSGVQYMLSGFHPEQAAKAKQRIIGIVVAALFLMAVGVISNWVSSDIGIDKDAATVNTTE